MTWSATRIGAGLAIAGGMLAATLAARAQSPQGKTPSQSRVAFAHALSRLDGDRLKATLVEVTYAPGGANTTHRHPCPVVGYVLEGALRMQVKGQPEKIYGTGETFYESPTDVHLVSANASQDTPARFLAYFVCDRQTPLSVPVTDGPVGAK